MAYQLTFNKKAVQFLEKINDPDYSKIKSAINSLSDNPRPNGYKKLKGREGYRIRVGDYRIIYEVFDKHLIIEIIAVGNRKNVYE
jgi:mRNA interferase RelE/StbE